MEGAHYFSTGPSGESHRRVYSLLHSSSFFPHNSPQQQDLQMDSRRPRSEGSVRVRSSLQEPSSSTNRDFWIQGNGHQGTAHPPSEARKSTYSTYVTWTGEALSCNKKNLQMLEKRILTRSFSNYALVSISSCKGNFQVSRKQTQRECLYILVLVLANS